jgi:hypothetical protein
VATCASTTSGDACAGALWSPRLGLGSCWLRSPGPWLDGWIGVARITVKHCSNFIFIC